MYHCYLGIMEQLNITQCKHDCEYSKLTASACDLSGNLKKEPEKDLMPEANNKRVCWSWLFKEYAKELRKKVFKK